MLALQIEEKRKQASAEQAAQTKRDQERAELASAEEDQKRQREEGCHLGFGLLKAYSAPT